MYTCGPSIFDRRSQSPNIPPIRPSADGKYSGDKSGEPCKSTMCRARAPNISSVQPFRPIITVHYEEISHLSISLHALADSFANRPLGLAVELAPTGLDVLAARAGACRIQDACDASGKSSAAVVADSRLRIFMDCALVGLASSAPLTQFWK